MKRYYLLTIYVKYSIKENLLTNRLNKSLDWIQPIPNVFLIESTATVETWNTRLKPILNSNPFFLVQINPEIRTGWMPRWVWDWLKSKS